MTQESSAYILESKKWIQEFVIHHNLCPFAKVPFDKNRIEYYIMEEDQDIEDILPNVLTELQSGSRIDISNSFIICLHLQIDFVQFLEHYDRAIRIVENLVLEEEFQLVSFHPQYQYAQTDLTDPVNLTNRSPYPMIHILRVDEVAEAIKAYGDTQKILVQNQETLNRLHRSED